MMSSSSRSTLVVSELFKQTTNSEEFADDAWLREPRDLELHKSSGLRGCRDEFSVRARFERLALGEERSCVRKYVN